jgi:hypothetical protein
MSKMTDPESSPVKGHPSHRVDHSKPLVRVKRERTQKPNVKNNPDKWYKNSRTTPGMTNRINEERVPANPGPFQYQSYKGEMADTDVVNNTPVAIRQGHYMKMAAASIGVLVLMSFF